jgi:hypothetical protein
VGQIISVPLQAAGSANGAGDFRVYDPSEIIGETSPHMPAPPPAKKEGCGFLGKLLMIVVAVIVTGFTAGTGSTFWGTVSNGLGNIAAGTAGIGTTITATIAGNVASQMVGLATGTIDEFSWKSVALAGVGAGVSTLLPSTVFGLNAGGLPNTIARAMVSNAITQGIGVITGLQDKFSWTGVAAAGVGAGVGQAVSKALAGGFLEEVDPTGLNANKLTDVPANPVFGSLGRSGEAFMRGALTGLAAGTATALARGGRVSIQQVATDAFGNALGSYFADELGGNQRLENLREEQAQQEREDIRDAEMARLMGIGGPEAASAYAPRLMEIPAVAGTGLRLPRGTAVTGLRLADEAVPAFESSVDGAWTERPLREALHFAQIQDDGLSQMQFEAEKKWSAAFGDDWQLSSVGANNRSNARYRSGSIVELSRNEGRDGVMQGIDDLTGLVGMLGDYRAMGNSLQLRAQVSNMQGELADIRKDLFAIGKKPPLETYDLIAPGDGARVLADKLTERRNYVRLVVYEKMGVLTLNDDLSIRTIGKDKLTPEAFLNELSRVAERSVAAGAREADALAKSGDLRINRFIFGDSAEAVAKGNVVDQRYKRDMSEWLVSQRVPEGAFGIVSINRHYGDPENSVKYRIPDVLVNLGPRQVYALDATLGTKTSTTPQVRDSLRYVVTQWGNVTRNGLDWIYNTNNSRIRR